MASTETIYINFTGGIVSPGYLKEVLELAALAKVTKVRFGLRQQLIVDIPVKQFASFSEGCIAKNISFSARVKAIPNIVSSYPATNIFTNDSWLREGVYKDIFNSFDYTPNLKINICDSNQTFVPFFTGHVNWVASASVHFWYLYLRLPKSEQAICFSNLVYTNDIAAISQRLEEIILLGEFESEKEVYNHIKNTSSFLYKPIEKELQLPRFSLPYYEGFNKHDNNYWLGIYRREEVFSVAFLQELCAVCMSAKIGQMYTTPWKSIVIKGIETKDRHMFDRVLGKYRINVRHAANELNWQIEDNCENGLQLKRHIIRFFDKEDVRTYGLSFAVKTRRNSSLFGSVIIRRQEVKNPDRLKALERFEILYTADFNPNTSNLISFRKDVEKEHVGTYLVSLCKSFYERESEDRKQLPELSNPQLTQVSGKVDDIVYHCKHCFTTYDKAFGDVENGIAAGTDFSDLPYTYQCPLCEAGKEDFVKIDEVHLQLQTV